MMQPHRVTGSLLAVALLLVSTAGAVDHGSATFRIMSEAEIAIHTTKMQTLPKAARDEYRDAQYRLLRQRALGNGYQMPESPPWRTPGPIATAPSPATDLPKEQTIAPAPDSPGKAKPPVDTDVAPMQPEAAREFAYRVETMDAYRNAMREHFHTQMKAHQLKRVDHRRRAHELQIAAMKRRRAEVRHQLMPPPRPNLYGRHPSMPTYRPRYWTVLPSHGAPHWQQSQTTP